MDKDIYGGVADSRPLRRHNPTLGAKEREERETSKIRGEGVGGEHRGGEGGGGGEGGLGEGTKCSLPPVE